MTKRTATPFLILLLCTGTLVAHDFWLTPPAGTHKPGETIAVEVAVGMDFPHSESGPKPERLTPRAIGPGGREIAVTLEQREDGKHTFAKFTPDVAGPWILTVQTLPSRIEMEAMKFNDYLLHDGLPQVLAARMDAAEWDQPAVEQYSRSVKTVVAVGASTDPAALTRPVGQTLEIVPLSDPFALRKGMALQVQVLFRDAPLAGARVGWDLPGNGDLLASETWTGADGKCWVPVSQSGIMLLRLIHMTRPRAAEYEWESFWSSLTFHVPE